MLRLAVDPLEFDQHRHRVVAAPSAIASACLRKSSSTSSKRPSFRRQSPSHHERVSRAPFSSGIEKGQRLLELVPPESVLPPGASARARSLSEERRGAVVVDSQGAPDAGPLGAHHGSGGDALGLRFHGKQEARESGMANCAQQD